MKKRIVCVLLALIMLVGLVPATAITAAAATGSMSESAITVLKSLEKYETDCDANGYIGYGTKCTESETDHKHGSGKHTITETEADAALRKMLGELSTAVNDFAGKYGLGLSQAQHDALVMFSFENGTAWTSGTGDLQTAIRNRSTGSEFLDAICKWNYGTGDDERRMIEANMYLNGAYDSAAPSRFIRVTLNVGDGTMKEDSVQYYDVLSTSTIDIEPTPNKAKKTFAGWYYKGERVNKLNKSFNGKTLEAKYQGEDGVKSDYTIKKSALASTTVYFEPNGEKKTKYVNHLEKEVTIKLADELNVIADYVDTKGVHWAKIADKKDCVIGWVKVSGAASGSTSTDTGASTDLMVTVTNSYVNMRKDASIYSVKVGTRSMGAQLRILKVKSADGFVWGQVANSPSDLTPVGWIALMYTDYETVKNTVSGSTIPTAPVVSGNVVARATIIYNGYVNVRSEAGTQNPIVGSLAYGTTVDVYETTYVNGIKWGRCSSGWFCMTSYAKVETLVNDTNTSEAGFASYVFSITLKPTSGKKVYVDEVFRVTPYADSKFVDPIKKDDKRQALESDKVVVSNLVNRNGDTWAKSEYGWIKLFDANGNLNTAEIKKFDDAKFNVIANELTVRANPENGANRVDVLSKGVELIVNRIVVDKTGSTVWGYADKADPTYAGWVNLATKNVSRVGAPTVANPSAGSSTTNGATAASGTVATVINTASVRVRQAASITATQVGTLTGGSTYAVLAEKDGWYKLDVDTDKNSKTDSWVYGQYLDVKSGTTGSTGSTGTTGKVETGMGIVANTYSGVNIRAAAGTGNAMVGKYLPGTTVEILEVTTYGASKWGRTDKGWVCMDYIAMVSNYLPQGSTGTTGGNTTGGNTSGSVVDSTVAVYTGYVTGETKVYKQPTITSDVIRTLNAKDPVTVHELVTYVEYEDKTVYEGDDGKDGYVVRTEKRTTFWARVNDGYISLATEDEVIKLHALDEVKYTANKATREVKGSGDEISLSAGETVTITKVRIVKDMLQGYVEYKGGKKAWFDLAEFTKGTVAINKEETTTPAPENNTQNNQQPTVTPPVIGSTGNTSTGGFVNNTSGYKYTGKVINTNQVNVRASASTAAKITTTLKSGAALVIYETVIAENMAWGRCDAGWVYLYYVDLTPCINGAVDARVVYTDNAIVYTDMNCSGVAGSYSRMSVVDIYEIVGKMAKTDLGWVSTDDML